LCRTHRAKAVGRLCGIPQQAIPETYICMEFEAVADVNTNPAERQGNTKS
jgi:hypothetical protein